MLILLNVIIIVFLLIMAALWATYGFFSAFIELMIVITAGIIALAIWEPMAYWLLGIRPEYAHGIGLLLPFVILLIVLRIPFDKFCKMNLHLPRLADQIGGGACGVLAAVLAFGMLLNGANFLPIEPGMMGWEPYVLDRNDVRENDNGGQLWPMLRVNDYSGGFFELISGGAMSPIAGPSLADARPSLAKRAAIYRLQDDPHQMKSAHPETVKVLGVYSLPASRDDKNENDVADVFDYFSARTIVYPYLNPAFTIPEAVTKDPNPRAALQFVLNAYSGAATQAQQNDILDLGKIRQTAKAYDYTDLPERLGVDEVGILLDVFMQEQAEDLQNRLGDQLANDKVIYIVDTNWNSTQPGTYNPTDNNLRVAMTQVRLQPKQGDELKDDMIPPVAFSIRYNRNTGARTFTEVLTSGVNVAGTSDKDVSIGWVFLLPNNQTPGRLFARELRFDLDNLTVDKDDAPRFATAWGALNPPRPPEENGQQQGVQIGDTGVYAEVTERLPRAFNINVASDAVADKTTKPWTLRECVQDDIPAKPGGRNNTLREIWVDGKVRLVRLRVEQRQYSSLYGAIRSDAEGINVMRLKDTAGNYHDAIGYVLKKDGVLDVNIRRGTGRGVAGGGVMAKELPAIGQGEELYIYFQVPVGRTIERYYLGSKEEKLAEPLEVPEKTRR